MKSKNNTSSTKIPLRGERIYWNQDTENAVIRYNLSKDPEEREEIYKKHLQYPLDKMAENVINRFKFPYINQTFEDLKGQVVSHLMCNLHKFTQDKGKAFSYFSVISKNYLILHNNNAYKEDRRIISLYEPSNTNVSPIEEVTSIETPNQETRQDAHEFVELMVEYWDRNLYRIFKKKRDVDIAQAVLELFRRADGIENFNKKNLYLLVREQTDCKTSYITKVVNKMRVIVTKQLREYHQRGTVGDIEDHYFKYN